MASPLFGIPWPVLGSLCLVVAAIYTVVWPGHRDPAARARPAWRRLVLRWCHALVWLLLALSCFVRPARALGGPTTGNVLALLALVAYVVFLGTTLADRAAQRPRA
jgi:hypothetical protein